MDEKPVPLWQRLTALAAVLAVAAAAGVWRGRVAADFWPPDASRVAPNLLASVIQWALVLFVAALVWPPTRRRIHRFVTGHTEPLHDRLERVERLHRESLRHMQHIVKHHPGIPDLPDCDDAP